ncbi:MAG: glycosyltransferase family 2 protein [Flavobacteriales bacterium]
MDTSRTINVQKLSIIIPAYNEEQTISAVLKNVLDLQLYGNIEKEMIVINDCSKDSTAQQIDDFAYANPDKNIISFHQPVNMGKGAAIHRGIDLASGDYIVIQDADLELEPSDINLLLEGLTKDNAQVIYGSRFLRNDHQNTKFVWHIMGNGFLTKLSNVFSGFRLTDMMTCYKLVPADILKKIELKENRFGFEPEVTLKLSKIKGLKIKEVPISYIARNKEEGKKISSKDGMRVIYCILKYFFRK